MPLITDTKSALNVHVPGMIGTFRVSKEDDLFKGVEVRYLLTHITLSQTQGQTQLLDMLAPVREVFDLKQLGFDEIMQRDIDDARVSLDLIPYLLDSSTSGQIKLFPPIVAIVLPLQANSRMPESLYRTVSDTRTPAVDHPGHDIRKITAGPVGAEQFEFVQYYKGNTANATDGAMLNLSRDNCALAIVDGQHRAMALLALYRNLTGGWSDAKRSPYQRYYNVWPDKEIRSYNLDELQLPLIICAFPQLDGSRKEDLDVVRAARRVFLTLNKTAKKVSDSRNRLLNDQDIVAECLRETLAHIKQLDAKDNTGLRIWNVELDQEGDRTKVGSDVAFSGVSHLYHLTEHILMSQDYVRSIETKSRIGRPFKRLDMAFLRLGLKDSMTAEKKEANSRANYSDEVAEEFRSRWGKTYVPIIERIFSKFHAFAAFSKATLGLHQELIGQHAPELEKMLFDGQATARTFDDFREGLERRIKEKEPGWTSPEIAETLDRVEGLISRRHEMVEGMKASRTKHYLSSLSSPGLKKVSENSNVVKPVRDAIDRLFDSVFSTVAFQTAIVCTYTEAIEQALGGIQHSTPELVDEYINAVHTLFAPANAKDLARLIQAFVGNLILDPEVKLVPGGPIFHGVVLPGELQPAEWPKYRYLLIELWNSQNDKLKELVETDRLKGRQAVAASLHERRLRVYCVDNRVAREELTKEQIAPVLAKAKSDFEEFLKTLHDKSISLDKALFEGSHATDVPVA